MKKLNRSLVCLTLLLFFACSHKAAKTEPSETLPVATASPTPDELSLPMCNGAACSGSGAGEYLKTAALPKIMSAKIVHECFLDSSRAKAKELAPGHLSYRFEIKLTASGDEVTVDSVYLSHFVNVPAWVVPCLKEKYEHMTFPPFKDPGMKGTTAFGTASVSWKKGERN